MSGIHNYRRVGWRVAAALLAAPALLLAGCDAYFFYPRKEHVANPVVERFAREEVSLETADGVRLHGWLFPAPGERRGTVLFFHGNAENVSTHVGAALWLVPAGYRLILFDYRGYGRSEGRPDMDGIHRDARAALAFAHALPGAEEEGIVVLGQSLGGAVAIHAVAHDPAKDGVRALVVEGAFSGYRSIAREKVKDVPVAGWFRAPLSWLVTDWYSPERWIGTVAPVPVLVIHGDADKIVPVRHGERLHALAGEPRDLWIVPGAPHIGAFASREVRDRLLDYLVKAERPANVRPGDRPGDRAGGDRPGK